MAARPSTTLRPPPATQCGPAGRAARPPSTSGFTLVEIGIALLVLALALAVVGPGLSAVSGTRMRAAAGHLSSAMRALYAEAALSGRTCRIAFDLDGRSYAFECAKGAVRISGAKEVARDGQRYVDEKKEADEAERLADLAKTNPLQAKLESKVAYEPLAGLAKVVLPDDVTFESVWVEHQAERYTAGDAYLYFFPQGHTEHAIVALRHKDDLVSVVSSPLTGRVELRDGLVEAPKS